MNPRHIQLVIKDPEVQAYYKGKLVQSGPIHRIRDWIDDEEQMHQITVHRRVRRLRNARRAKRRNCLRGVIGLMTKEAISM